MTEQPMPTPNGRPSIQSLVRADLEAREQVGIERYGTALQAFNGRSAARDAYEEVLDLACYWRQEIAERQELDADLRTALELLATGAGPLHPDVVQLLAKHAPDLLDAA